MLGSLVVFSGEKCKCSEILLPFAAKLAAKDGKDTTCGHNVLQGLCNFQCLISEHHLLLLNKNHLVAR